MKLAAKMTVLDRAVRRAVDLPGTLRSRSEPFDIVILDLSASGFRGSMVEGLSIGDEVSIATPSLGPQTARLAWVNEGQQGFAFDRPLPQNVVDSAGRIDTVVEGPFPEHLMAPSLDISAAPEPQEAKWPLAARLMLILGGAVVSWAVVIVAAMAIMLR